MTRNHSHAPAPQRAMCRAYGMGATPDLFPESVPQRPTASAPAGREPRAMPLPVRWYALCVKAQRHSREAAAEAQRVGRRFDLVGVG